MEHGQGWYGAPCLRWWCRLMVAHQIASEPKAVGSRAFQCRACGRQETATRKTMGEDEMMGK